MSATLANIGTAILAALQGLLDTADPPGPFKQVAWWAGETDRSQADQPAMDARGKVPAALLAFARETPASTERTTTGEIQQVLASRWIVFVVVSVPREPAAAPAELFQCIDAVTAAVLGTQVDGSPVLVTLVQTEPWRVRPGSYTYAVTLAYERVLGARGADPESDPLEQVDADVLLDGADTNATPAARVRADDLYED